MIFQAPGEPFSHPSMASNSMAMWINSFSPRLATGTMPMLRGVKTEFQERSRTCIKNRCYIITNSILLCLCAYIRQMSVSQLDHNPAARVEKEILRFAHGVVDLKQDPIPNFFSWMVRTTPIVLLMRSSFSGEVGHLGCKKIPVTGTLQITPKPMPAPQRLFVESSGSVLCVFLRRMPQRRILVVFEWNHHEIAKSFPKRRCLESYHFLRNYLTFQG